MEVSWHRRIGYAVHRRWRILQGIARFYGAKAREGVRSLWRGRVRWVTGLAGLTVLAALVILGAWGLFGPLGRAWRLPDVPGASAVTDTGGTPPVSGVNARVHQQLATRGQPRLTLAAATPDRSPSAAAGVQPPASAGQAGQLAQPALGSDALPRPGVPEPDPAEARPRTALHGLTPPVDGSVVAGPGWRRHSSFGHWYYDPGIRLAAAPGGPVRAVLPGTVVEAGPDPDGGLRVVLDHAEHVTTVYGQLDHVLVPVGQHVSAHAPVGLAPEDDQAEVRFAVYLQGEAVDPTQVLRLP